MNQFYFYESKNKHLNFYLRYISDNPTTAADGKIINFQ